ncbi:high-affinity lysophosphatidic acid receptor-like [Dendronephthya gigantea]|uniref:high-affinity lysophosphatidic acid receptor-like n=1 Tax=Dendronephthya gigantea TaxID=151771 RepID=UPI00106D2175|nr:high-affinity lysophosphatidic acid receptor-like [Dendronephthya gigantea]
MKMVLSSRPVYQVILEVCFTSSLGLCSIVLNLLACANIWRNPLLRTWHNIFTINLIIIDLITSVFSATFTIIVLAHGEWPMSSAMCNLSGYINAVLATIAINTLALFSFSRYHLFAHSKGYLTVWNKKRSLQAIGAVWIFAFLVCLPPLFGWGNYRFLEKNAACFLSFNASKVYGSIFVYGVLAFPLSLSAVYLVRLHLALRTRRRVNSQSSDATSEDTEFRQTIRAAKSLIILAIAFILCWLPVFIVYALDASGVYLPRGWCLFSTLMIYVFSVILPLIYTATSSVFTIGCCTGCVQHLKILRKKSTSSVVTPEGERKDSKGSQ